MLCFCGACFNVVCFVVHVLMLCFVVHVLMLCLCFCGACFDVVLLFYCVGLSQDATGDCGGHGASSRG